MPVIQRMMSNPWMPMSFIVPPCLPHSKYHAGRLPIIRGCPEGFDLDNPQRILMDPELIDYVPSKQMGRQEGSNGLELHDPRQLLVADFNNDGLLDIYVTCYHSGRARDCNSYIYWGMPGGLYSVENRTRMWGHSSSGCMAADLNEDGWVDLAVAHHKTYGSHPGFSKIWWNGPEGFRQAGTGSRQ